MICRRCNRECDGTMMRTDRRYTLVANMLKAECPLDAQGRLEVCHRCQRAAYFANGFISLLVRDVTELARFGRTRDLPPVSA